MAGTEPDPLDLSQGGVAALSDYFRSHFSADATLRGAVLGVLAEIADGWDARGGMVQPSYLELQEALGPHLKALLELPPADCKSRCDRLVEAWEQVRPTLVWC